MKLTQPLRAVPRFRYWKDWGAGKQRRIVFYKYWWSQWRGRRFEHYEMPDMTLKPHQLPPNARIMDAQDFMQGHISLMPEQIIESQKHPIVYNHPWPFNVAKNETESNQRAYYYSTSTRFYQPKIDSQVFTNTILQDKKLKCHQKFAVSKDELDLLERNYNWAIRDDSILSLLPIRRKFPFMNIRPQRKVGILKPRAENHVLNVLDDFSQSLLARYYQNQGDKDALSMLHNQRTVAFPHCQVPIERDNRLLHLNLYIDNMTLNSNPLPPYDENPEQTASQELVSLEPQTWRSLVEQTKNYDSDWTFSLPNNSYPSVVQLSSLVDREFKIDEMLARSIVHLHGLAVQFARLRSICNNTDSSNSDKKLVSTTLEDPLAISKNMTAEDILKDPIVIQACVYERHLDKDRFHFIRYQLNTVKYDENAKGIKNQAWYSGPVKKIKEALQFYLDFHSYPSRYRADDKKAEQLAA